MPKKPKRTNLKGPGRCIFCGGFGLSKEHVIAEWVRKAIPHAPGSDNRSIVFEVNATSNDRFLRSDAKRQGHVHARKVRVVCGGKRRENGEERCNTGWMSRLEAAAEPIILPLIRGDAQFIPSNNQIVVASWVCKTAMTAEYLRNDGWIAIPQSERDHLMANLAPPANWQIWIATLKADYWTAAIASRAVTLLDREEPTPQRPRHNTQLMLIGLGRLLCIAFSSAQGRSRIILPSDHERDICQIWPTQRGHIEWPRTRVFSDAGVERFANGLVPAIRLGPGYMRTRSTP